MSQRRIRSRTSGSALSRSAAMPVYADRKLSLWGCGGILGLDYVVSLRLLGTTTVL